MKMKQNFHLLSSSGEATPPKRVNSTSLSWVEHQGIHSKGRHRNQFRLLKQSLWIQVPSEKVFGVGLEGPSTF